MPDHVPQPEGAALGVASQAMGDSLRRTLSIGVGAWCVVSIVPAAMSDLAVDLPWLVFAHLMVVPLAIWGITDPRGAVATVVAGVGIGVLDTKASTGLTEPTLLATVWTMNFVVLCSSLLGRGRRVVVGAAAAVVTFTTAMAVFHPEWGDLVASTATTGLTMVVAVGALVRFLYRYADRADVEANLAAQAREQALAARAATREAVDSARTLHDTVINTLAAIASGGAAIRDTTLVRERCARDLAVLEPLTAGDRPREFEPDLASIGQNSTLVVVRAGAEGERLAALQKALPGTVLSALRGAADEAVRNAEHHAGVGQVEVSVSTDEDAIVVTISDRGRGFAGLPPAGRGISESVLGRVRDVGGDAAVVSHPGEGTVVTLEWAPSGRASEPESPEPEGEVRSVVDAIRRTACWAWTIGVVTIGVLIDAMNRPGEWSSNYWALMLVAVVGAGSWLAARGRADLPVMWTSVLVVAVAPVFVLTYLAVETEPHRWLALTVTPLFVTLLVLGSHRAWLGLACGVLVASAVATAWGTPNVVGVVVVGVAVPIGLLVGWFAFYGVIGHVAQQAERARHAATSSRAEIEAQSAMRSSRARWAQAGLAEALDTLKSVASGAIDPSDEQLRRQAADQERFLRQIMMLSPEAVHLAPPLARALAEARSRGVELTVQTGDADVATAEDAASLGQMVRDCVTTMRPGSELKVSTYPSDRGGLRLLVVGDDDVPIDAVPDLWPHELSQWGDQRVLEVVVG